MIFFIAPSGGNNSYICLKLIGTNIDGMTTYHAKGTHSDEKQIINFMHYETKTEHTQVVITEDYNKVKNLIKDANFKYSTHLTSETKNAGIHISEIKPHYGSESKIVDARIILRENFNAILEKYPEVLIFGEDVGKIGDVNQGLEGLQEKYGKIRVSDTGY